MKGRSSGLLAALVAALVVTGLPLTAAGQTPKGLEGTWTLDAAKSTFSPGPAPKGMTVSYTAQGDALKIVVDVTPSEGAPQHWEMAPKFDGKEYPVTGHPTADSISVKVISERRVVSTLKKNGKVTGTTTRTLSADGKTLTIAVKGTTPDGKPRSDVQVLHK